MTQNIGQMTSEQYRQLQIQQETIRWQDHYGLPASMYWPVFAPISSKRKGDIWEAGYLNACSSLLPRDDRWHDASLDPAIVDKQKLKGKRIEIKYSVIQKPDSNESISERGYALEAGERAKLITLNKDGQYDVGGGGAFQQVHPENAQYGLFSAVHANGAVHYWVPYHLISRTAGRTQVEEGRILLSSQHDGGTVEGQLNRTKNFHKTFFLAVTIGTPYLTDLSGFDLARFDKLEIPSDY